ALVEEGASGGGERHAVRLRVGRVGPGERRAFSPAGRLAVADPARARRTRAGPLRPGPRASAGAPRGGRRGTSARPTPPAGARQRRPAGGGGNATTGSRRTSPSPVALPPRPAARPGRRGTPLSPCGRRSRGSRRRGGLRAASPAPASAVRRGGTPTRSRRRRRAAIAP